MNMASINNNDQGMVLLIDKPFRWTSFDVVKKVRNAMKIKKVGHSGTLDPLATGLLILCTGPKTKTINQIQDQEKEYQGTFTIGATTPSYDLETEIINLKEYGHITTEMIHKAADQFTGWLDQIPPQHSAIKKDGQRAYVAARAGKEVVLEPRKVEIKVFEITAVRLPEVDFRVVCSKGTYIRSLARDFGEHLGTGAYLSALTRVRIGAYHLDNATTVAAFLETLKS